MRILICFLFAATASAGTIKGVLVDGTNGGEGSADQVRLILLDQFMKTVGSVDNVTGSFEIEFEGDLTDGNYLLQAQKGPVMYSESVVAGSEPFSVTVFDNVDELQLSARMGSLALYAHEGGLDIGMFFNLDNLADPKQTLVREDGTFTFPMVPGHKGMEANTQRGRMPLKQSLRTAAGMATLDYPLKPGRTQLMVRFGMDYNPEGETYTIPMLENQQNLHLLALPTNLKVEGPGLTFVDTDRQNGAKLFAWERDEDKSPLVVTVSGKPLPTNANTAQAQQSGSDSGSGNSGGGGGHKVERTPDNLAAYRWWVIIPVTLGLSLLALLYNPRRRTTA